VEDGLSELMNAKAELDAVYAAYAEPDADFDALAKKQGQLEALIEAADGHDSDRQMEIAADALRLPPWDADVTKLSG
ncbi:energy-dependent translational throttle protein EttA, partial [Wenyingzhuangia sp. 1_MG-2023]|nr:energy-dependent translational throttle protein EttA [Wenyingzhuangia sp. 1_MG-2023]